MTRNQSGVFNSLTRRALHTSMSFIHASTNLLRNGMVPSIATPSLNILSIISGGKDDDQSSPGDDDDWIEASPDGWTNALGEALKCNEKFLI